MLELLESAAEDSKVKLKSSWFTSSNLTLRVVPLIGRFGLKPSLRKALDELLTERTNIKGLFPVLLPGRRQVL
ncbi:hypothetical protein PCASD_25884 [Puccinia coronata f. sp. avenae]|uniref:Uncharacterized protein n=1 Tax=Puccinia coronata f. sp. avenae TaxID=200324 RepID=A0A2N5RUB7_9BASI|nr:hypothetical protein PCASD_25884 [Puccinia coronata f. sp. avenae]